jgi:hypothetical protein
MAATGAAACFLKQQQPLALAKTAAATHSIFVFMFDSLDQSMFDGEAGISLATETLPTMIDRANDAAAETGVSAAAYGKL